MTPKLSATAGPMTQIYLLDHLPNGLAPKNGEMLAHVLQALKPDQIVLLMEQVMVGFVQPSFRNGDIARLAARQLNLNADDRADLAWKFFFEEVKDDDSLFFTQKTRQRPEGLIRGGEFHYVALYDGPEIKPWTEKDTPRMPVGGQMRFFSLRTYYCE